MSDEQAKVMYIKSAESRKGMNVKVSENFFDYVVERDYAINTPRIAKELDIDEED